MGRFMTQEDTESQLSASPTLDIWSLGIIICEVVVMAPIMRPMYKNFAQNGCSVEEAGLMFMEWLGCMQRFPMPKAVQTFDADLEEFLIGCMLVLEPTERHTLRQCLTHDFVMGPSGSWQKLSEIMPDIVFRDDRGRHQDHGREILLQGTLWK